MEKFELSEIQAQAILDLRLARLTPLERQKIETEYADLQERIAELRDDPRRPGQRRRRSSAKSCWRCRQSTAGTTTGARRSSPPRTDLELEDMIAEEDMVIAITRSGYIKRLPVTAYREQRRGGIGVMGMELKEDDYIEHLFVASTHDYILFFTNVGKVYRLKVHELPLGSRQSKGRAIVNLLPVPAGRAGARGDPDTQLQGGQVPRLRDPKNGSPRRPSFIEYNTPLKADGIIAIKMREATSSSASATPPADDDILLVSRKGQAIRFHETDVRSMGRASFGCRGHDASSRRRGDRDRHRPQDDADLLVVTENGYGKRTRVSEYPVEGPRRYGREDDASSPRRAASCRRPARTRRLSGDADLHHRHRDQDPRRGRASASGRSTQGVIVMRLRGDEERVSSLAPVVEPEEDAEDESSGANAVPTGEETSDAEPESPEPGDES